jgi:hypothetical protein
MREDGRTAMRLPAEQTNRVRLSVLAFMMATFNREWHLKNKFPKDGTEGEKNAWRDEHGKKCSCGRKKK